MKYSTVRFQYRNPLEKGTARATATQPPPMPPGQEHWPTYRRDAARSGTASSALPEAIVPLWTIAIPDPTAPVIAGGRVLVAARDAHALYSLDSATGETVWTWIARGRIDSPPTYAEGRVVFGTAYGWVTCLDADTGQVAWRFRAAPRPALAVAYGHSESLWPVHGSVLVLDGTVYAAAGRQSFLDGGIHLYALDLQTGQIVNETRVSGPRTADDESVFVRGSGPYSARKANREYPYLGQVEGNKSDILVSDGELIYLRHMAFNRDLSPAEESRDHLLTVSGFLDPSGHHRSYWTVATRLIYDIAITDYIDGDLLVMDGDRVFGTRVNASNRSPDAFHAKQRGITLFAATRDPEQAAGYRAKTIARLSQPNGGKHPSRSARFRSYYLQASNSSYVHDWQQGVPFNGKAMLKARNSLYIAGTPVEFPADDVYRAVEGRAGGTLAVVSTSDGSTLKTRSLEAPPVWDGMAAANKRLVISLANGHVQCWGAFSGRADMP